MTEIDFIDFLKKKKINPETFQKYDPVLYKNWLDYFIIVGKNSFDQQKKFLFNAQRKKFPLP